MKVKTTFAFFCDALAFRNMATNATLTMSLHICYWFLDDITHMVGIFLIYNSINCYFLAFLVDLAAGLVAFLADFAASSICFAFASSVSFVFSSTAFIID